MSGTTVAAFPILIGAAMIYWSLVGLGVLEEIPVAIIAAIGIALRQQWTATPKE